MSSERFARQQRLCCSAEFKQVFAQPKGKIKDRHFTVLGKINERSYARLGLGIPKRYIPKAVARNRIKRLIRESFRQHQHLLAGLDIVVTTRTSVMGLSNNEFFLLLDKHWRSLATQCELSSSS